MDAARTRSVGATLRQPSVLILAVAGVTALLASLINPAGAELVVNALSLTAHPIVRAVATEWQPAYPWLAIAAPLWALLVLLVLLRAWRVASGAELVAGIVLLVLALAAIRSIPWFTLMILPLLARAIDRQLAAWPTVERALGRPGAAFSGTRTTRSVALFAAVLLAFQLVRPALPPALARLTLEEPVALVDVLEQHLSDDAPARVFNEQSWGGYLVYRLGGRVRTYLDGRLDTAPAEVWRGYYAILTGPDAVRLVNDLGVDWVLLRSQHDDLLRDLRSSGYEPIAADAIGELLRAPDD